MKNRKQNRLADHDYSQVGIYFVTICTRNRTEYLGEIKNAEMILYPIGQIVRECWEETSGHFPNADLGDYVVMPNHVHGITTIKNIHVGDADLRPLRQDRTKMELSKMIHGFKSSVTRRINRTMPGISFGWRRSFYEHIIRNDDAFNNIKEYITRNPQNWKNDRNNLQGNLGRPDFQIT